MTAATKAVPRVSLDVLLNRLELAGLPQLDQMARSLGLHWPELARAMMAASSVIRSESDQLEIQKATTGLVAYGVAIGFFYRLRAEDSSQV
jgi:hypothetical protein